MPDPKNRELFMEYRDEDGARRSTRYTANEDGTWRSAWLDRDGVTWHETRDLSFSTHLALNGVLDFFGIRSVADLLAVAAS